MQRKQSATPVSDFGRALRHVRTARGLPQEEFDLVSSRTYISALERGLKSPTLPKVDSLAEVLGVHPLTLIALAFVDPAVASPDDIRQLLQRTQTESAALLSRSI